MKDFSDWQEYEGSSEGSGRSEKIWLQNMENGKTGLFKLKKDVQTTDHISECIACQIADLLGIPCAKFETGSYKGRDGSMSYNIIENSEQILIEGVSFITNIYPEYDPDKLIDGKTGRKYSIEMIVEAIEKYIPCDDFIRMLMFDYLIGNSDRHQSNWAMILENSRLKWSPLYDNGSSLCAYISEEMIKSYLGNDKNRWRALVDTKSRSRIRCTFYEKKPPTHLSVMKYVKERYPIVFAEFSERIFARIREEKICNLLDEYSASELSDDKKRLITQYLLAKCNMLRQV